MRRFAFRLAILAAPFLAYAAALVALDPYDYFAVSRMVPDSIKQVTSFQLNPVLEKFADFKRRPGPNILLGDSRTFMMDTTYIEKVAGEKYFNLAFGGASLAEMISAFWYAAARAPLKKVYWGLNFNHYNGLIVRNRGPEALGIIRNPLLYFFKDFTVKGLLYNGCAQILHRDMAIGDPKMSRDQFWQESLGPITEPFYAPYAYPAAYHRDLAAIAGYCREKRIRLVFIIQPTHTDLQNRIDYYNLREQQTRFKVDLAALGTVYDFDYPNVLTADRDHFDDPYHCKTEGKNQVVDEVWGNQAGVARILKQ